MDNSYELLIVGCGPAGLSAAINAKIRGKKLLLLGGEFCTARLHKAPHVDNYLGFPDIGGADLREKFLAHVQKNNIDIVTRRVSALYPAGKDIQALVDNDVVSVKTVILATGLAAPQYLPGEQSLIGKGVSYCATCDGALYKGKKVIVLGETAEAEEEANFLAEICQSVSFLPAYGEPRHLKDKIQLLGGKPTAIKGENAFRTLETDTGSYEADGIFIIREVTPVSQLMPELALENNFIKVDHTMAANIPGVFAAGDCTGPPYQVAKSVGEGLIAALSAAKYIDS
ncbi:MAG: NAD(P)/FAD-dependent oxidoreductase [Clostridia bacterium]|nr:NAD(P)/FAD-dependent oxidoreductase [Clostridia bacterium]